MQPNSRQRLLRWAGRPKASATPTPSPFIRDLQHHRETGALAALNATGAHLCLAREPDNEHDVNAVAVYVDQCKLGYVAKEQAACLAPFLDEGSCAAPLVRVERVALASPLPQEREEANAGGDDAMEVVKQEQVEEADNEQLTEGHPAGNVLIKPDPNVAPTSPPFSPAPIPTSLTIIVHAVVQQESIFLALQQAFPPPPQSPGALAALEEEKVQAERDRLLGLLAAAHGKIEREGRTGLRVLSLFDGISAALVALLKESCPIALYCSSEIDEDALEVMEAHYPTFNGNGNDSQGQQPQGFLHVPLGDVRLIDERMIELIQPDLIIGGSPCQDLSRMNMKGKGLEGDRSKLFFEFIRVRDLCLASSKGSGAN